MTVNVRTLTREKREVPMTRFLMPATTLTTLKKIAFTLFCCTVLMVFAAVAQPNNLGPPAGAILDLNGQPVPGGGKNIYQQYTAQFTASGTSTAITFAFREDPGYISFAKVSVVDLTANDGVNLLTNGDFSGGTVGSTAPTGWTYANNYGVTMGGGTLQSFCGVGEGGTYGVGNCWLDGAVQAYDAISQAIVTNVNHVYQISFWVADDSGTETGQGAGGCATETPCNFSDISTNGDTTDRLGNGINVAAYAQAGLPPPGEELTLTELGQGSGNVTDNKEQINCTLTNGSQSGTCSASYSPETVVTLTETTTEPSTFGGWGGACASFGTGPTCTLTMNSAQNASASFNAPGPTQDGTVMTGTPTVFNFQGGFAAGGYDYNAELTSGSPVLAQVTVIPVVDQSTCNTIVNPSFPGAQCFVYQNGNGPNTPSPVMFELTCPGSPGGTCGTDVNPNFFATLGTDFNFSKALNPLFNSAEPLVGWLKGVGSDPLHPCTQNAGNNPPLFHSNQISSFSSTGDPTGSGKGTSGGTGSCWLLTYNTPHEAPSVNIVAPANGGVYEQGQVTQANYICTTVNNGNSATGPYLTQASCTAIDSPGGAVAQGGQFDTSTLGTHTFTATVVDSATNTVSQAVSYTVVPLNGKNCNGVFTGTFKGNLTVSNGQSCTFTNGGVTGNLKQSGGTVVLENGSFVNGNLQTSGGSLSVSNSTVGNDVQINGGGMFSIGPGVSIGGNLQIQSLPASGGMDQVCGATVKGDLQFQNNGTAVLIGGTGCAGNGVGGNLTVQNNTASTTVDANMVGGNLTDQNNTAATQVFTNAVTKNLRCQGNGSITGGGNTAASKKGQCATF